MRQLQELAFGTRRSQALDQTEGHAGAAVTGQTGRFVHNDEISVFTQNREFVGSKRLDGRSHRFIHDGCAHRRNADFVVERNLCLAFGALFVDTHFSVSHDAVYVALWNAF